MIVTIACCWLDCRSLPYSLVLGICMLTNREFDRSFTPKMGDNNDHLEQVRRFILKNGFQEPIIISCDLKTGNAFSTEGNHRLWVAHKEGITFIPCCVIPH